MGAGWRLGLGLILEVLGILVAVFSIAGSPRVVVTRRRLSLPTAFKI